MDRLLLVLALVSVAGAAAFVVQRRSTPDPPTQTSWSVPTQLDRTDFAGTGTPWLVAVFSSATCLSCRDTWGKVTPLASDEVAVDEVEVGARKAIHENTASRVPCVVSPMTRGGRAVPREPSRRPVGRAAGCAARSVPPGWPTGIADEDRRAKPHPQDGWSGVV